MKRKLEKGTVFLEFSQATLGEGQALGLFLFHFWEQQREEIKTNKATFGLTRFPGVRQERASIY